MSRVMHVHFRLHNSSPTLSLLIANVVEFSITLILCLVCTMHVLKHTEKISVIATEHVAYFPGSPLHVLVKNTKEEREDRRGEPGKRWCFRYSP